MTKRKGAGGTGRALGNTYLKGLGEVISGSTACWILRIVELHIIEDRS